MKELSDAEKAAYYRRCYTAVDGLWFMKLEAAYGFEAALQMDRDVWAVLPKIQARCLKAAFGVTTGREALRDCLTAKLRLEEFQFEPPPTSNEETLVFTVTGCPWYELMQKSGRQALAGTVGRAICNVEYAAWADEFGPGLRFQLDSLLCQGDPACRFVFSPTPNNPMPDNI
jgi:hypothetical protein